MLVNVYQNDLAYVHAGDAVDITTDAYPTVFHGNVCVYRGGPGPDDAHAAGAHRY